VHVSQGVDLTDEGAVMRFFQALPGLWASIHLAGGFAAQVVAETSLAAFRRQLDMNLVTAFLCSREAIRVMRKSPGAGGRIVNVSARPAVLPSSGMVAYSVAKAGVAALSVALAEELKSERIWVNAVVPSIMDTPANRAAMPTADHSSWPSTVAVAEIITFLASPANEAARGGLVPVYGAA
jgi:NAD(P)-dependent dehydrogenase (short-subunit alcohol dehydrogenase family)